MPAVTDRVRQELAVATIDPDELPVELAALLRGAGQLVRDRQGLRLELLTSTGATARRAHQLLRRLGVAPTVLVREATAVDQRSYGVLLAPPVAAGVGGRIGLLDDAGRPVAVAPEDHLLHPAAMVRGALLGAGSVSGPGQEPHLELRTTHAATAAQLATAVGRLTDAAPSVGATRSGHRVVLKSGRSVAALLAAIGATSAYLAQEEQLLRRELRADVQRLTNADAANVRRAVEAATEQVRLVQRVVDEVGWDAVDEDLRDVALARLANPSASLAELGELCDPPVGKSAVHRRLARLRELLP